ncbi:hypothetical protein DID75_02640 [Candidatus Marinamargulisbacteria bacterium SCGC AG-410-N11]|nr:hypothetical protein DID75_02640 [Candidatus Marinamargulisbacteria bacterium SCGC AG-410-N11]
MKSNYKVIACPYHFDIIIQQPKTNKLFSLDTDQFPGHLIVSFNDCFRPKTGWNLTLGAFLKEKDSHRTEQIGKYSKKLIGIIAKGFNKTDYFTQVSATSSLGLSTKSVQLFATKSSLPVLITNIDKPIVPLHQKTAHAIDTTSQASKLSVLGINKLSVNYTTENILFLTGRLLSLTAAAIGIGINTYGLGRHLKKLCTHSEKPLPYRSFRIAQHAMHLTINAFLFKTFFSPEDWLYSTNLILMGTSSLLDIGYGTSQICRYRFRSQQLNQFATNKPSKQLGQLTTLLDKHYTALSNQHITSIVSNSLVMTGAFYEAAFLNHELPKEPSYLGYLGWIVMGMGILMGIGLTIKFFCTRRTHQKDLDTINSKHFAEQLLYPASEEQSLLLQEPLNHRVKQTLNDNYQFLNQIKSKPDQQLLFKSNYVTLLDAFYRQLSQKKQINIWKKTFQHLNKSLPPSIVKGLANEYHTNNHEHVPVHAFFNHHSAQVYDLFYRELHQSFKPFLKQAKSTLLILLDAKKREILNKRISKATQRLESNHIYQAIQIIQHILSQNNHHTIRHLFHLLDTLNLLNCFQFVNHNNHLQIYFDTGLFLGQ